MNRQQYQAARREYRLLAMQSRTAYRPRLINQRIAYLYRMGLPDIRPARPALTAYDMLGYHQQSRRAAVVQRVQRRRRARLVAERLAALDTAGMTPLQIALARINATWT